MKRDWYKRIVGKVLVGGQDAGLEQLGAGMTWHYKKYQGEQIPIDRIEYAAAEDKARAARLGRDSDAVPPWVWRDKFRLAPR